MGDHVATVSSALSLACQPWLLRSGRMPPWQLLLGLLAACARATMPPTQPVWTDDGKWPPRELHDVMAPNAIVYEDLCPQKTKNAAMGPEVPVACPPNVKNNDT